MEGTVTIKKDEYLSLLMRSERLSRLERGGVDNWEWYGDSMFPDDQPDLEEYEKELIEKIKAM